MEERICARIHPVPVRTPGGCVSPLALASGSDAIVCLIHLGRESVHGLIRCTEGQAAIFSALWSFKGVKVDGERVMLKAGQDSDKPNDLFKVKIVNKGKPEYEGPLHAYRALVESNRRQGLYWMPCASHSSHS